MHELPETERCVDSRHAVDLESYQNTCEALDSSVTNLQPNYLKAYNETSLQLEMKFTGYSDQIRDTLKTFA